MRRKADDDEGPVAGGWNPKWKKTETVEGKDGKDREQSYSTMSPGAGKPWGERGSDTKDYKHEYNVTYYNEVTSKKAAERGAGSDGNYMTKQNLWLAHRVSEMLYRGIPDGMLLPDWAESKINSATQHLKEVAGWAMHESHGDELHHGPEANPIHLGDRALRSRLVRLAHARPELRPHLLPLLKTAAADDKCVVCGKPGEAVRYNVRGSDGTELAGRVFIKGSVLCDKHQEMLGDAG